MKNLDYQNLLAELRAEYLAGFNDKFTLLTQHYQQSHWAGLESEFHKLKGTGKTYGVPEVSTLCQQMEFICRDRPQHIPQVFTQAISLLAAIKKAYLEKSEFDLANNPGYLEISKYSHQE